VGKAFRVIGLDSVQPLLNRREVIAAVRSAFVRQTDGSVQSPAPGQLLFTEPPGDCHIKFGHVKGASTFVVKIASGFYRNPEYGLPVNHGMVVVIDAHTGAPQVLFKDDGWLTAWRTAAAAALSAAVLAPGQITSIGVLGTGLQASLALEWLPETLGAQRFVIWGRSGEKARELANTAASRGIRAAAVVRIEEIFEQCNVVITTTPAPTPLFSSDLVKAGTHLVGIGADGPNKQELPADLFARASCVLVDDHAQCLEHGDFGAAVRSGAIASSAAVVIGDILGGQISVLRSPEDITIVDLTGLAVQDIAIANLFLERLGTVEP
jgi:ornithine cyclodeaminase